MSDLYKFREQEPAFEARTRGLYLLFVTYLVSLWFPGVLTLGETGISLNILLIMLFSYWALVIGTYPKLVLRGANQRFLMVLTFTVIGLIILSTLSFFHAQNPFRVGRPMFTYIQFLFILTGVLLTVTETREKQILNIMVFTMLAVATLTAMAHFLPSLGSLLFQGRDRTSAFFKNPNQFGIALSSFGPIVVAYALAAPQRRWLYAIGVGTVILALIASGSKTNLLVFSVSCSGVLLVTAFTEHNKIKGMMMIMRNIGILIALAYPVVWALATFNPRAARILFRFVSGEGEAVTVYQRQVLWAEGIQTGLDSLFLGQGAGQLTLQPLTSRIYTHSHNVFVDHFRTLGLPGALLLTILVIAVVVFVFRMMILTNKSQSMSKFKKATIAGFSFGIFAFLMSNQLSDSLGPSTTPLFWVLLVMLAIRGQTEGRQRK